MKRQDQIAIYIVSIIAVILILGLLYKSYTLLIHDHQTHEVPIDSNAIKKYYEQIEVGPASVELSEEYVSKAEPRTETHTANPPQVPTIQEKIKEPSPDNKNTFIIVTGAFSSQNNANKWVEKMKKQSFIPDIHYNKERGLYFVYVKSFTSENAAIQYSNSLKSTGVENQIKILP